MPAPFLVMVLPAELSKAPLKVSMLLGSVIFRSLLSLTGALMVWSWVLVVVKVMAAGLPLPSKMSLPPPEELTR